MTSTTKCLNEWNATVEALGQGKQTILIRKYNTSLKGFLLYPTVSYANKDNFTDSFEKEEKSFVKKNALPKKEEDKIEVKYYAKVEDIIKKPSSRIGGVNKYHIWTNKHVKSYIGSGDAYVWILRVYTLEKPLMLSRTRGMLYANVDKDVSVDNIKPVLSDKEFNRIKEDLY